MVPVSLLMIRPRHFGYNAETAGSNAFQQSTPVTDIAKKAQVEFDEMVNALHNAGVAIRVFDDPEDPCPDAVFPNNWLAMLPDKTLIVFPMMAQSRRREINPAIIESLQTEAGESRTIDISSYAEKNMFLEGTGSIVFDHQHRIAYACESPRTNSGLLSELCEKIGYRPVSFRATDLNGKAIYHTNVLMSIGTNCVVICTEAIDDAIERAMLMAHLRNHVKTTIEISHAQMNAFAGNIFQVQGKHGKRWIMSTTARDAFTPEQLEKLSEEGEIVVVRIPVIEKAGGGSARCMVAGLFI